MKKVLALILTVVFCMMLLAGCKTNTTNEISDKDKTIEGNKESVGETSSVVVRPLPEILDVNSLDNCTVAVSLEKGDAYVDDTGKMVMELIVYSYDLYDMVDIVSLKVNDVIVRRGEEITITELERLDSGLVIINGGEENGGFSLTTANNTVYYEIGMSDRKAYYELGNAVVPVSTEFRYYDKSNLDSEPKMYYPGDFLIDLPDLEYNFTPYNTTLTIQNGHVIEMVRIYNP